ncbi:hypothetical protein [Myroides odoratimimus]|uniref:hypothetical protein n=1 Tax=Myroides odoratimimus TaxID=76832 RepID=UPI002576A468|nr:hypothetical protein [Myroides odoratimimus]MDM1521337.1 hypothetical protein [Myroides odoratimimus]
MEREYIRLTKPSISFPKNTDSLRILDDVFWKKWVFYHLLSFYKNYDNEELKEKIEAERKKKKSDIEDLIAVYIREYLRKDRLFGLQGLKIVGGVNNDLSIKGLYDISILHSYWDKELHFECKNLDCTKDLVNKYVCYNKGKNIYDGGVLRYFNGKYAQNSPFGGMIGFILTGDSLTIKNSLVTKLKENLHTTPEGDLIKITDNSIGENNFTFDSIHKRFDKKFTIHHLLFDFSK